MALDHRRSDVPSLSQDKVGIGLCHWSRLTRLLPRAYSDSVDPMKLVGSSLCFLGSDLERAGMGVRGKGSAFEAPSPAPHCRDQAAQPRFSRGKECAFITVSRPPAATSSTGQHSMFISSVSRSGSRLCFQNEMLRCRLDSQDSTISLSRKQSACRKVKELAAYD
jgi:hypothetical protein